MPPGDEFEPDCFASQQVHPRGGGVSGCASVSKISYHFSDLDWAVLGTCGCGDRLRAPIIAKGDAILRWPIPGPTRLENDDRERFSVTRIGDHSVARLAGPDAAATRARAAAQAL